MGKAEKIFGQIRMTWLRVILLSVITGIVVGLLMIPASLKGTSFQEPGISFEFWILFALYIVLNCQKPLEAGVKTFTAFLISQPLIYLVQVPFASLGFGLFRYYPYWFALTLLCFPGGMIAWFVKKGNLLSVFILSVANVLLCCMIPETFLNVVSKFPYHLISLLFMIGEVLFFIFLLIHQKKLRIIALGIAAVLLLFGSWITYQKGSGYTDMYIQAEGSSPYEVTSENDLFEVFFSGDSVVIRYRQAKIKDTGTTVVTYTDGQGQEHEIHLTYKNGSVWDEDESE